MAQENKQVAVRIIDIPHWQSPVAKQATREFKLPGLPYVRVYGPTGNFLGAVQGDGFEKIKALLDKEKK